MPAVTALVNEIDTILNRTRQHLQAAQNRQKQYADQHRSSVAYQAGDMVLLSNKNINIRHPGSRKLLPLWLGPFRIIEQVNPVAYRLELPDSMHSIHPVFHTSVLRKYRAGPGLIRPPPPVELDGELEYEVERILDKRMAKFRSKHKRVPQYLIKWKGYGHEHNTWEPLSNLTHCNEILQAFELQQQQQTEGTDSMIGRRRRGGKKRTRLQP